MRAFDVTRMVLLGAIIMLSTLLLFRVLAPLRFVLLIIVAVVGGGYMAYRAYQYWQRKRADRAFSKTTEGQLVAQDQYCDQQVQRLQEEIKKLELEQEEIRVRLANHPTDQRIRAELSTLAAGFAEELQLRRTKITFYEDCRKKLAEMLQYQRTLQLLREKREKLEQYQAEHYDEIASMEELRYQVEQHQVSLETIGELSLRMGQQTSLSDAEALQQALQEIQVS